MMRLVDRTLPRNKIQIMPQILSFFASAVWHGIEPGLFVTFFGFGLLLFLFKVGQQTVLCDSISRALPFYVYHLPRWIFFWFLACYYEICFELRHIKAFGQVHAEFYHVGAWLTPLLCVLVYLMPKVKRARSSDSPQANSAGKQDKADDQGNAMRTSTEASPKETKKNI